MQNSFNMREVTCHGYLCGDYVDTLVWDAIAEILQHPDLILDQYRQREQREYEESKTTRDYIAYCEEQIHQFEEQRSKVLDLYLNDRIPKTLLDEKLADIDQKLETHRGKLSELRERLTQTSIVPDNYEELVKSFCDTTKLGIDNFTEEEKRAVVEALDIRVFVQRGQTRADDVFELTGFIPTVRIGSASSNADESNNETAVSIGSTAS